MSYESWRISFQDSEQAARASYREWQAAVAQLTERTEQVERMREAFQRIRAIDNGEAYRIASEAIGVVP